MIVKKLGALGAMSLIVASTAASAAPAPIRASDSVVIKSIAGKPLSGGRAAARTGDENALAGGGGLGVFMLVAVGAGAAYGAYEMIHGDDSPASN